MAVKSAPPFSNALRVCSLLCPLARWQHSDLGHAATCKWIKSTAKLPLDSLDQEACPHLHRDWAHPCRIHIRSGLSRPGAYVKRVRAHARCAAHMSTRAHTDTHTPTHARTHTSTHARTHTHARARARARTGKRMHAHAQTHTHPPTSTRAHTHAHARTNTLCTNTPTGERIATAHDTAALTAALPCAPQSTSAHHSLPTDRPGTPECHRVPHRRSDVSAESRRLLRSSPALCGTVWCSGGQRQLLHAARVAAAVDGRRR